MKEFKANTRGIRNEEDVNEMIDWILDYLNKGWRIENSQYFITNGDRNISAVIMSKNADIYDDEVEFGREEFDRMNDDVIDDYNDVNYIEIINREDPRKIRIFNSNHYTLSKDETALDIPVYYRVYSKLCYDIECRRSYKSRDRRRGRFIILDLDDFKRICPEFYASTVKPIIYKMKYNERNSRRKEDVSDDFSDIVYIRISDVFDDESSGENHIDVFRYEPGVYLAKREAEVSEMTFNQMCEYFGKDERLNFTDRYGDKYLLIPRRVIERSRFKNIFLDQIMRTYFDSEAKEALEPEIGIYGMITEGTEKKSPARKRREEPKPTEILITDKDGHVYIIYSKNRFPEGHYEGFDGSWIRLDEDTFDSFVFELKPFGNISHIDEENGIVELVCCYDYLMEEAEEHTLLFELIKTETKYQQLRDKLEKLEASNNNLADNQSAKKKIRSDKVRDCRFINIEMNDDRVLRVYNEFNREYHKRSEFGGIVTKASYILFGDLCRYFYDKHNEIKNTDGTWILNVSKEAVAESSYGRIFNDINHGIEDIVITKNDIFMIRFAVDNTESDTTQVTQEEFNELLTELLRLGIICDYQNGRTKLVCKYENIMETLALEDDENEKVPLFISKFNEKYNN